MASFRSKYAFPILYYILSHERFKQRQMARELGYKHGGSISDFVNWLESLEFVEKFRDPVDRINNYRVASSVGLVKFYSNFRKMQDLRISLDMNSSRKAALEYFKKIMGFFV